MVSAEASWIVFPGPSTTSCLEPSTTVLKTPKDPEAEATASGGSSSAKTTAKGCSNNIEKRKNAESRATIEKDLTLYSDSVLSKFCKDDEDITGDLTLLGSLAALFVFKISFFINPYSKPFLDHRDEIWIVEKWLTISILYCNTPSIHIVIHIFTEMREYDFQNGNTPCIVKTSTTRSVSDIISKIQPSS